MQRFCSAEQKRTLTNKPKAFPKGKVFLCKIFLKTAEKIDKSVMIL